MKIDTIITHPENLKELFKQVKRVYGISNLNGIEIITEKNMPRYGVKWEFPATRFVEYSKADIKWAEPLRFGRWVEDRSNLLFYGLDTQRYKFGQIPFKGLR